APSAEARRSPPRAALPMGTDSLRVELELEGLCPQRPRCRPRRWVMVLAQRLIDTPQGLEPHGFSLHRRRHPRDSTKALSAPENVSGRVLVSIEHESTGEACVGTNR